jgi:hypothetical protein
MLRSMAAALQPAKLPIESSMYITKYFSNELDQKSTAGSTAFAGSEAGAWCMTEQGFSPSNQE